MKKIIFALSVLLFSAAAFAQTGNQRSNEEFAKELANQWEEYKTQVSPSPKADDSVDKIYSAMEKCDLDLFTTLLNGIDPNVYIVGRGQLLHVVISQNPCSMKKGDAGYNMVKLLLERGANKDSEDFYPYGEAKSALFFASRTGELYDVFVLLLQYGADYTAITGQNDTFGMPDRTFKTLQDVYCVHTPGAGCIGYTVVDKNMGPGYYSVAADNGTRLKPEYNYVINDVKFASKGKPAWKYVKYLYYK